MWKPGGINASRPRVLVPQDAGALYAFPPPTSARHVALLSVYSVDSTLSPFISWNWPDIQNIEYPICTNVSDTYIYSRNKSSKYILTKNTITQTEILISLVL